MSDDDAIPGVGPHGLRLGSGAPSVEDYRHMDHMEVVAETPRLVVLRDTAGNELNDWADALAVSRSRLSQAMHDLARRHYQSDEPGDPWSATDPLVLAKQDERHEWAADLGLGELRRLAQHMDAIEERSRKVWSILDESGALDSWEGKGEDTIHHLTSIPAHADVSASDAREAYQARKREGGR